MINIIKIFSIILPNVYKKCLDENGKFSIIKIIDYIKNNKLTIIAALATILILMTLILYIFLPNNFKFSYDIDGDNKDDICIQYEEKNLKLMYDINKDGKYDIYLEYKNKETKEQNE